MASLGGMRILVSVVVLAFGCATPALAAPKSDYSLDDTRRLMAGYAKCVVQRRWEKASEAILKNVDNGTILKHYRGLIDGDCLTKQTRLAGKMTFAGDLYRYALADALVAKEFGASGPVDFSAAPKLVQRAAPEAPKAPADDSKSEKRRYERELDDYNEMTGFRVLGAIGECVVRLDPVSARALVLSKPTTDDEDRHFETITPTVANCLPEGETVKFGKLALRGTIAINYYRLAHANR